MAKIQKKSSLCNEKIQCTCKFFEELQKIKLIIAEMEITTVGKIPFKPGETSDKVRMFHGFIKYLIDAMAKKTDECEMMKEIIKWQGGEIKNWLESNAYWREAFAEAKGYDKLPERNLPGKIDANPGEGKIPQMNVNKNR